MKYLCAALALVAGVQSVNAQALEFKGVTFGASVQEFVAKHDYFNCAKGVPCELLYLTRNDSKTDQKLTYASEQVHAISAYFIDNKLEQVIIEFEPRSFEKITNAVTAKYGKPKSIKTSSMKNGFGQEFTQVEAAWKATAGNLKISKYDTTSDVGRLFLFTDRWIAKLAQREKDGAAKAASDL